MSVPIRCPNCRRFASPDSDALFAHVMRGCAPERVPEWVQRAREHRLPVKEIRGAA